MSPEKMEMPTNEYGKDKTDEELLKLIKESEQEVTEINKEIINLDQQEAYLLKQRENLENKDAGENQKVGEEVPKSDKTLAEEKKNALMEKFAQREKVVMDSKAESRINNELGRVGLGSEQMKNIPGWDTMTEGQRMLVLNRYQNFYVENIKANAEIEYQKRFDKAGGFKKMWMNFGRTNRTRKIERELLEKMTSGGLNESKKAHFETLVEQTIEHDFKVNIVDGKISVDFANTPKEKGILTPEQIHAYNNYNIATTALMQIPEEWGSKSASKRQKMQYEQAKQFRDTAESSLLEVKKKLFGEELAISEMNNSRAQTDLVRFDLANPTIGKAVEDIRKTSWKDLISRRDLFYGGLFFLGAGVRKLGITAPIAGGLMGGFRGWLKGKEKLKKQDKMSRRGELTEMTEAKSILKGTTKDKTIQDITSLTSKIGALVARIEEAQKTEPRDNKKIQELTRMLSSRIEYTETKMEEARVNHGNDDARLNNRFELIKALTSGRAIVSVYSSPDEYKKMLAAVSERAVLYETMLDKKINRRRVVYLTERVVKGAILGAAVAEAGKLAGDAIGKWFDHSPEDAIGKGHVPGDGGDFVPNPDHITQPTIDPDAVVHYGDSPESLAIKQIMHRPDLQHALGYTGDPNDLQALKHFAGRQAHLLAMDEGYFQDIHNQVGPNALGINHAAYQLEIGPDGKVSFHEYFDGKSIEVHNPGTPFETDREKYEFLNDLDKHRGSINYTHHPDTTISAMKPEDYSIDNKVLDNTLGVEDKVVLGKVDTQDLDKVKLGDSPTQTNTNSYGETSDDIIKRYAKAEGRLDQKPYKPSLPVIYPPGVPHPLNILDQIFGIFSGRR